MPGFDTNGNGSTYTGGNGSTYTGGNGPTKVGGSKEKSPSLPTPGDRSFSEFAPRIGAAEEGGENGNLVVSEEIPGHLGTLYTSLNKYLLMSETRRQNSTLNGMSTINHRYRGHREANKFNLSMQKLLALCVSFYIDLKEANISLTSSEVNDMYPTDTEIESINHTREQIEFKEWLLLKDDDKKWFI